MADKEPLEFAIETLQSAKSGLHWYQDHFCPRDNSDDDMDADIDKAVAGLETMLASSQQQERNICRQVIWPFCESTTSSATEPKAILNNS